MSKAVAGWRLVAELQSLAGYDPLRDSLQSVEVVGVSIEPAGRLTMEHRRVQRQADNRWVTLDPEPTYDEDGQVDGERPLWQSAVGERPTGPPPSDLLLSLTPSALEATVSLVVEASELLPTSERLRGWYRLPSPRTTPTERGKGGRNVREWAELAALYIYAFEVSPDAPVKWLSQEFSYTGYPSSWWHGIASDLSKRGFLEERQAGQAGGVLGERSILELEAHRR